MSSVIKGERGAGLVEATIAMPLFLICLLIAIDLLRISYNALTVQYVASRIMRQAVVGPPAVLPVGSATFEAYLENEAIRFAGNFGVRIDASNISLCPVGPKSCETDDAGAPGQLIGLRIKVPVSGLFGGSANALGLGRKQYDLETLVLAKNESYDQ